MESFEDLSVGDTDSFGAYEVTREELTDFAGRYDPQPVHTDPEAAADSMFGGLVASGWHTAAMTMRMLVDHKAGTEGSLGSPGIDQLRWRKPVRAGDVLSVDVEVLDKEVWDEDRGVVVQGITTRRQDDEPVMTMEAKVLYSRR
jgi:acyl dehydratase